MSTLLIPWYDEKNKVLKMHNMIPETEQIQILQNNWPGLFESIEFIKDWDTYRLQEIKRHDN